MMIEPAWLIVCGVVGAIFFVAGWVARGNFVRATIDHWHEPTKVQVSRRPGDIPKNVSISPKQERRKS